MTAQRALGVRIRAQAKTGESYTTARSRVLAARSSAGEPGESGRAIAGLLEANARSLRVRIVREETATTLRVSSHDASRVVCGRWKGSGAACGLWRAGHREEAGAVFARLLGLRRPDTQGARFHLEVVLAGEAWSPTDTGALC